MCGDESIPKDSEILANKNVALIKTMGGGHIGYFTNIFSRKQWFVKPTMDFIEHASKDE